MPLIAVSGDFAGWRDKARAAILAGFPPEAVAWCEEQESPGLFEPDDDLPLLTRRSFVVPRRFVELAEVVAYHRDLGKWALLYRILWRLLHDERELLEIHSDADVRRFHEMHKAVTRDAHKMKAFVRFRRVKTGEQEHYVAWHQPDHPLLRFVAPFFKDRFHVMHWTIFTPDASVTWDGHRLHWGRGCSQQEVTQEDAFEDLWRSYYASIFNPARIKTKAMKAEMPRRYWRSLPETHIIDALLEAAPSRVAAMLAASPKMAEGLVPLERNRESLSSALQACRICPFACEASPQWGQGSLEAGFVVLTSQVAGPRILSDAAWEILQLGLKQIGLSPERIYITAAVKHSKQGRVQPRDLAACKPWLTAELALERPRTLVCLGLTSGLAIFGRSLRREETRGRIVATGAAPRTLVTLDLEGIVSITDAADRQEKILLFCEELRLLKVAAGEEAFRDVVRD